MTFDIGDTPERVHKLICEKRHWDEPTYLFAQIGKLAEEVGEAVREANHLVGNSRHPDLADRANLGLELADVIITAYCMAYAFHIDVEVFLSIKLAGIRGRGGF